MIYHLGVIPNVKETIVSPNNNILLILFLIRRHSNVGFCAFIIINDIQYGFIDKLVWFSAELYYLVRFILGDGPGLTLTGLLFHKDNLMSWNFRFRNQHD